MIKGSDTYQLLLVPWKHYVPRAAIIAGKIKDHGL